MEFHILHKIFFVNFSPTFKKSYKPFWGCKLYENRPGRILAPGPCWLLLCIHHFHFHFHLKAESWCGKNTASQVRFEFSSWLCCEPCNCEQGSSSPPKACKTDHGWKWRREYANSEIFHKTDCLLNCEEKIQYRDINQKS